MFDGGTEPARAATTAAALAGAGWSARVRAIAGLPDDVARWRPDLGVVVVLGADGRVLADAAASVHRVAPEVGVVVLATVVDGELLSSLLRDAATGRVVYGQIGDGPVELATRAQDARGCTASESVAAALLGRVGGRSRDHDVEIASILLTGGGRADLASAVAGRPDLLASVVEDAAGRALKRLALDAAPEDRAWLAHVLDRAPSSRG